MALDRQQVLDGALALLAEHGLASLSMRRLAAELGVAPGALYWHVASKQELLAEVAEAILGGPAVPGTAANGSSANGTAARDPRAAAGELRAALLRVRDGAEVVSFALALRPDGLRALRELPGAFPGLAPEQADWAARTLTYFVLGAVAEEQNRAELVRAGIVPATAGPPASAAFRFGVEAILAGLDRLAG